MKKAYIVLILVIVFGVGAIALFNPEEAENTSSNKAKDNDITNKDQVVGENSTSSTTTIPSSKDESIYKNGSYQGNMVSTPYGDVKISILVEKGKITDVTFIQMPEDDQRSTSISQRISNQLESDTINAQSSDIDAISGATYTSDAYINSLQSAIDEARAS